MKKLQGAWWVITHWNGKRRKKRIGPAAADRRAAEKIAAEINARLALGLFQPVSEPKPRPLLFEDYARRWLRSDVELPISRGASGALSPATAELHERHLRLYLIPFLGGRSMGEIRVAEVQALYDHCLETGRPPSDRSVEMVIATLGRILAYAEAREEIGRNPVEVWKRSRGRRRRGEGALDVENVLDSQELGALLGKAEDLFPADYPLVLFLADTGARLGEALALRWIDVDMGAGTAEIRRSFSSGKRLSTTKTGRGRRVELSLRLRHRLACHRPDLFGGDDLVFANDTGGLIDPHNFRDRVFRPLVRRTLGRERRFTPHGLRHTFASLHMARGTPLKWIQAQGGWSSARVLLDTYGHHLPSESTGFADALTAPGRPYTAPVPIAARSREPTAPTPARETRTKTPLSVRPSWWARPDSNGGTPCL